MKFLLNMNVPRELGRLLSTQGHEYRHVGDVGMARAGDEAIIEEARANRETIVTHDLDYGRLLAFSGASVPSVIIFRLRNTSLENLFAQIANAWTEVERPLTEGSVVVLEDAVLRIRRLPIAGDEET